MHKIIRAFLSFLVLAWFAATATLYADSSRVITLKDGSRLKGTIVSFQNDAYSIRTDSLGLVNIPSADIVNIASAETAGNPPGGAAGIKEEANAMQQKVTADPQIMLEIRNVAEDKEIINLLNDPALLNDILSYDPKRIQNNPRAQELMRNPKIQNLINQIIQKTGQTVPAP